jgi:hypothetical protein
LAGFIALAGLLVAQRRVRQTTLLAPARWAIAAVLGIVTVEIAAATFLSANRSDIVAALRFAAAAGTVGPVVALLGAKRPQNRAWQLVVLSLWIILVLPAFGMLLLRPGGNLEVHWLRLVFLAVLIAIGLLNYVATRFRSGAILAALGQFSLLDEYLGTSWLPHGEARVAVALSLIALGLALLYSPLCKPQPATDLLKPVWRDFRDWFGAAWALRVAERVNATASGSGYAARLVWNGYSFEARSHADNQHSITRRNDVAEESIGPESSEEHIFVLERTLRSMMRRFVSDDWIEQRTSPS